MTQKKEQEHGPEFLKNRPLERIFQNNIARILDFFIINQDFDFTSTEISHISDIPLRTVQRIIPQLVEKKLVKEVKMGKRSKNYQLNRDSRLVEILNDYSLVTINDFIDEANNQEKDKILTIQKNNKIISDYTYKK